MNPLIITIFNLVAPEVFRLIRDLRSDNPSVSYKETLEQAGIKLDAEYAKLLEDMAQAVRDGAVPRVPPPAQ